jgi:DNA recombination protein Rad52
MAFTDQQQQALKAKLRYRHVKTRASNGTPISYVEGWHVIAEANRIFGYDSWDRQTLSPRCLWRETQRGETACFYTAKVRITVRAGEAMIVREGIGTGVGRSSAAEMAHEIALKAAETDATKRALATFGNPFGLALYDREHRGVTRRQRREGEPDRAIAPPARSEFELHYSDIRAQHFASAEAFAAAALEAVRTQTTVKGVYAFWEANLSSFAALLRADQGGKDNLVQVIGSALKERIRTLAQDESSGDERARNGDGRINAEAPIAVPQQATLKKDASAEREDEGPSDATAAHHPANEMYAPGRLAFPKERRVRDKAHLSFVANEPCLVCGRRPAQAHHIRFAQPRALGLKVSDEFTVPLCNGHHDSLHNTGDERAWWARHGILDPLQISNRLWAASRNKAGEGTCRLSRMASHGPRYRPARQPRSHPGEAGPW